MRAPRLLTVLLGVGAALYAGAQAFQLPGTQPDLPATPAAAKIQHAFIAPHLAGPGSVPYGTHCGDCHNTAAPADPLGPWQGSMMSQAARDFLFYAQLDLTNHDGRAGGPREEVAGMGDMCLRCHSPVGWLEGRSTDASAQGFARKDLFGVQCHFCHRLVDPDLPTADPGHPDVANFLSALDLSSGLPPTSGNGMYVVDPKQTRRGPYRLGQMVTDLGTPSHPGVVGEGLDWTLVTTLTDHPAMNSAFHRSSDLCGTCHDVSNPTDCGGAAGENTQDCFPIERTWSEWRGSVFATRGEAGTCQSCHMSGPLNGVAFGAPCKDVSNLSHLNDVHFHDLTGGNTFMPQVILHLKTLYDAACTPGDTACTNLKTALDGLYPPATGSLLADVNVADLEAGIARVRRTLKRSAYLDAVYASPNLEVTVTNRTGHKLPTGYPEGRRMWLNVRFLDAAGNLLAESGRYEAGNGALFHDQNLDALAGGLAYDVVTYTDATGLPLALGRPTKVWEGRMEHTATSTEFHFALNDDVLLDNRIPPEGWNIPAFTAARALPKVPAAYPAAWQGDYGHAAGTPEHWDRVRYETPAGTDRAEATIYYQTASREYIEALVADNPNTLSAGGYNRATLLEEAWRNVGRSAPEVVTRRVQAILDSDGDGLSNGWEAAHGGGLDRNGDPDGDGHANWQEFQNGTDPTDGSVPAAERSPIDLVLVLDTSGSMNDPAPGTATPKIAVLRSAVTLFLETWKDYAVPGDRIGVVYFGSTSEGLAAPLLQNFVAEWQTVRDAVALRPAVGWTALGAGLHRAVQAFPAPDPASPRGRHIVLFSNGMQNRSPMLLPDLDFPEFLVLRDQTPAENPEVTGGSELTLGAGVAFAIPFTGATAIRVHTVGIGVAENAGGTAWHKLLRDLATQQNGKHNFITRAFDLEGTFLQDLVEALRGNTLEYVLESRVELPPGETREVVVPINVGASRFSLVVSWHGTPGPAPRLELLRPDGVAEDVDPLVRGGSEYRILTRFLSNPDEHPEEFGDWTLRLVHPRPPRPDPTADQGRGGPLSLRVHAVLDDSELKYTFTVPGRRFRVGQPLRVTARASQNGRALLHGQVTVEIASPRRSIGAELAGSRHTLDAGRHDPDLTAGPFASKLTAAFGDPAWRQRLASEHTALSLFDDGTNGDAVPFDGTFARMLFVPEIPGHYELLFRHQGVTANGQAFAREERHSIMAGIGALDPLESGLRIGELDGRPVVELSPRDGVGNLLGPGYASQLGLVADGQRLQVEDLLDGRYRARLPPGAPADAAVEITYDGERRSARPATGKQAWKADLVDRWRRWFCR